MEHCSQFHVHSCWMEYSSGTGINKRSMLYVGICCALATMNMINSYTVKKKIKKKNVNDIVY